MSDGAEAAIIVLNSVSKALSIILTREEDRVMFVAFSVMSIFVGYVSLILLSFEHKELLLNYAYYEKLLLSWFIGGIATYLAAVEYVSIRTIGFVLNYAGEELKAQLNKPLEISGFDFILTLFGVIIASRIFLGLILRKTTTLNLDATLRYILVIVDFAGILLTVSISGLILRIIPSLQTILLYIFAEFIALILALNWMLFLLNLTQGIDWVLLIKKSYNLIKREWITSAAWWKLKLKRLTLIDVAIITIVIVLVLILNYFGYL